MDAESVAVKLKDRGYAVTVGSYGKAFKVVADDDYLPVPNQLVAPGLPESDIVVVDLDGPPIADERPETDRPGPGVSDYWCATKHGVVDPRPRAMHYARTYVDRIHEHGGALVVITSSEGTEPYVVGHASTGFYIESEVPATNWELSGALSDLYPTDDLGHEMNPTDVAVGFGLGGEFWTGTFDCTLSVSSHMEERFVPLATSKYGKNVAGILLPVDGTGNGLVVLLPPLTRIDEVVLLLVESVLPQLSPGLFEQVGEGSWTSDESYEHADVQRIKSAIRAVKQRAEDEVTALEVEMAEATEEQAHLHTLLTGTDDALVDAVITTLVGLGFSDVRDADAEMEARGDTGPKREDLHVRETGRPTILGEVKGIGGLPKESNSLQVTKYLAPRMREWSDTSLRCLSVVNHQRSLPPLQRENTRTFQDDVLINAADQAITLVTTWELFQLARNAARLSWPFETIVDLFYVDGRPEIVPSHYRKVGAVEKVWPKTEAFSVVAIGPFSVGDTVAVRGPIDYYEGSVLSIRLNDAHASNAEAGQKVGLTTGLPVDDVHAGCEIYVVDASPVATATATADEAR